MRDLRRRRRTAARTHRINGGYDGGHAHDEHHLPVEDGRTPLHRIRKPEPRRGPQRVGGISPTVLHPRDVPPAVLRHSVRRGHVRVAALVAVGAHFRQKKSHGPSDPHAQGHLQLAPKGPPPAVTHAPQRRTKERSGERADHAIGCAPLTA